MRLRSGRTYSSRYTYPRRNTTSSKDSKELLKFLKNLALTSSNIMSQTSNITIVKTCAIQPFAGRVKGVLTQSTENWIDSLEAHFAAKSITDDKAKYTEAKSYIDYNKGDIGEFARHFCFRSCEDWTTFKSLIRAVYALDIKTDEVLFLRSIIKLTSRNGKSIVQTAAELSDRIVEWADQLKTSSWVTTDTDGNPAIKIDKLMLMLQLTFITYALPDRLVRLFDEKLTSNSSEMAVLDQIRKHGPRVPDLDSSILNGLDKNKSSNSSSSNNNSNSTSQVAVTAPNRFSRNNTGGTGNMNFSPRNNSQYQPTCFNCGKIGHYVSQCYARYCSYHDSNTHKYSECKARSRNQEQRHQHHTQGKYKKHSDLSKHKNKQTSAATFPDNYEENFPPLAPSSSNK